VTTCRHTVTGLRIGLTGFARRVQLKLSRRIAHVGLTLGTPFEGRLRIICKDFRAAFACGLPTGSAASTCVKPFARVTT